jgi:hypothetical protein
MYAIRKDYIKDEGPISYVDYNILYFYEEDENITIEEIEELHCLFVTKKKLKTKLGYLK